MFTAKHLDRKIIPHDKKKKYLQSNLLGQTDQDEFYRNTFFSADAALLRHQVKCKS